MKIGMRLIVLLVTILIICGGCVSLGTEKRLAPGDLSSLAGRWTGYVQAGNYGRRAVELTISPDGSFVAYHAQARSVGVMTIVDGKVEARGQTTGQQHRSTASLYERDGKQILSGTGYSPTGPYSFQYEKIE
jgi:hypothetical protein